MEYRYIFGGASNSKYEIRLSSIIRIKEHSKIHLQLFILPLSLPPPPYDQDDNGSDKPAKQENYPNSDQKHLVGKIVVKGKIQVEIRPFSRIQ